MTVVMRLALVGLTVLAIVGRADGGYLDAGTVNWWGWNAATGWAVRTDPVNTSAHPTATPASVATALSPTAASTFVNPSYDAFVNLSSGGYAESGLLTSGTPLPWYDSPAAQSVFNGTPTAAQQAEFTARVLADVRQVYTLAGVPVSLTTDPTASAAHTLSVVSGVGYPGGSNVIGITDVGANGFSFIDKFANYPSEDALALAVSHNVAHELMHAFGVSVHHDTTGTYVDAATASYAMLTDPNATLSPASAQDLLMRNFLLNSRDLGSGAQATGLQIDGDQTLGPTTVPEPSAVILWLIGFAGLMTSRSRAGRFRPGRDRCKVEDSLADDRSAPI